MRRERNHGGNGLTPIFISCNRGKRSIAVDLKSDAGKSVLWKLLQDADVLAQNFRPGAIDRLGFSAEHVMEKHPSLIFLSISGVGDTGPYADKRVYDPVIQSLSGLADIQADPVSGKPRMVRTLIADKTTAIYAAQAVTAALFARSRDGRGRHVQLSMLDAVVSYLWPEGMAPFCNVAEDTRESRMSPHDMIYNTADGFITLGAISDREWRGVCDALEKPEWIDDPNFATPAARSQNRQLRLESVQAELDRFNTMDIIAKLEAADVPCAPVLKRRDVIDHPQVLNNQLVQQIHQPGIGEVRIARPAARFDDSPSAQMPPAPLLGQHSDQILAEIGYTERQRQSLFDTGAVLSSNSEPT
jgi:crotonobetainyl-CoA:carnitine CoA-transferase CaiB-like acyl-CoA transferase